MNEIKREKFLLKSVVVVGISKLENNWEPFYSLIFVDALMNLTF